MNPLTHMNERKAARMIVGRQDRGLPGAILLLQVMIAGGESPRRALARLSLFAEGSTPLAAACAALASFGERVELGARLVDALIAIERDPAASRSLIRVLDLFRRSEDDGEPLLVHLDVLAVDLRRQRSTNLDAAAQRLTVSMLFPLVLCILPAFIVLAVIPLVVSALAGLPG